MKVLLVSLDNLYLTPYMSLYIDILKKHEAEYRILYWDKNNNEQSPNNNFIRFSSAHNSISEKIWGYVSFRAAVCRELKAQKYDLVVCLHTICSFLLFDLLISKFRGKYIFDVRDYSLEKYRLVRMVEKQLVKYSAINIISSEGYKAFLPEASYEIAHNLPADDCNEYKQKCNNDKAPIRICYIGLIRFLEQNKRIIDFFRNDNRFQLCFIGTNAEQLAQYCQENGVTNVNLIGTFDPKQTLEFYRNTDLIMNLYGNHTPLLDYALSNKLYYAAMLYKPILVCPDTYMEKVSMKFGFGYVLNMETDEERDRLFDYVSTLDREGLIKNCNRFLEYVQLQQEQLHNRLDEMIVRLKDNKESPKKAK